MRSTLLFLAVLLACAPAHTQTTGPIEAPNLHCWLTALLPAPSLRETAKQVAKKRPVVNTMPRQAERQAQAGSSTGKKAAATPAKLLLHSPNAP